VATEGFRDKVILITGTARGCGSVLAEAFAAEGARVVGCDLDAAEGEAGAKRIADSGGEMIFVDCDISEEPHVERLLSTALEAHGRLDCAINNAGTETTGMIADADADTFDRLVATNLSGLMFCLKHEIAAMRRNGDAGGAILNMSSVTSSITAVPANGLYAATKGGVNALTKAAAVEVAKENIAVNALAFAAIDIPGDMIWRFLEDQGIEPEQLEQSFPVGRMGRPEELVAAVRYLCSEDARYCTGTELILDGGFTAQ
jgi:NAD(P)-dependent dehydrogenase (short-subunit alcohol dehydrogenase family)